MTYYVSGGALNSTHSLTWAINTGDRVGRHCNTCCGSSQYSISRVITSQSDSHSSSSEV